MRSESSSTCESDWISYSDRKCFKVLDKKGSESEAKGNCIKMDSSSTLITIESKEEQDFITHHIMKYNNISTNVWIGLEYIDNTIKWMDGKPLFHQNWGENSVKDGNSKCVQISLAKADLGKWTDDLCRRKYLIVCQKKQTTRTVLSEDLKNITKFIEKLQTRNDKQENAYEKLKRETHFEELVTRERFRLYSTKYEKQKRAIEKQNREIQSIIPLGFLYTQFPHQFPPQKLWPNMKWSEVTHQYSGLFFRAEGGGSEPFGKIQPANYSRISNIWESYYDSGPGEPYTRNFHTVPEGWDNINGGYGLRYLELFTTTAENRPRNTAIRIWERVK